MDKREFLSALVSCCMTPLVSIAECCGCSTKSDAPLNADTDGAWYEVYDFHDGRYWQIGERINRK